MADFVFATCLPGVEPAVKLEVARTRPELRFAYSRPGLVTFKAPGVIAADDPVSSVFARVWGRSIGAARDVAEATAMIAASGATRVHVFARDVAVSGATRGHVVARDGADAIAASSAMSARDLADASAATRVHGIARAEAVAESGDGVPELWAALGPSGRAQIGELVADVIVAAGEPAWIGIHRHSADRSPSAGGERAVTPPPESPSRAYAKLEEAIAWARLPIAAGQVALEIGSAPGGAALALAQRGVTVWGVDTGDMAPQVLAYRHANHARVHHLAIKVGALRWEQLPARVDWLLVDVNLAPQVALHEIARLMPPLRDRLRGAIFTLKLNDWAFVAQLPALAARIAELGMPRIRMQHLPSNRHEVCCVALP